MNGLNSVLLVYSKSTFRLLIVVQMLWWCCCVTYQKFSCRFLPLGTCEPTHTLTPVFIAHLLLFLFQRWDIFVVAFWKKKIFLYLSFSWRPQSHPMQGAYRANKQVLPDYHFCPHDRNACSLMKRARTTLGMTVFVLFWSVWSVCVCVPVSLCSCVWVCMHAHIYVCVCVYMCGCVHGCV